MDSLTIKENCHFTLAYDIMSNDYLNEYRYLYLENKFDN